jgi:hypothetical protein
MRVSSARLVGQALGAQQDEDPLDDMDSRFDGILVT